MLYIVQKTALKRYKARISLNCQVIYTHGFQTLKVSHNLTRHIKPSYVPY